MKRRVWFDVLVLVMAGFAFLHTAAPVVAQLSQTSFAALDGTCLSPSYQFVSASNYGIGRDAQNTALQICAAGAQVARFAAASVGQVITGQLRSNGPAPAINTCGTATVSGSDTAGTIVITAGTPTSCTVNFANTWNSAPACAASDETTLNALAQASATTTVLTISRGVGITGVAANFGTDTIKYVCVGRS